MFFKTPAKDSASFEAAVTSSGAPCTSLTSWMRACVACNATPNVPRLPVTIEKGSIVQVMSLRGQAVSVGEHVHKSKVVQCSGCACPAQG